MKYIFLDIDGVLNKKDSWIKLYQINEDLVKNLSAIVKQTNAKIILSSSWRKGWDEAKPTPQIKKLNKIFSKYNIEIFGITPILNRRKRDDDESEYRNITNVYFVCADKGLTIKDAKQIIRQLK